MRLLGDLIDVAVITLAAVLIVVMSVNVLSRVALNADIAWNTEFGEFVLVWATFLGGAAAARRGGHMRITELVAALPRGLSRPIEMATRLLALVIIGLLVFHGVEIVSRTMDQEMTVLYWPVGLQYLSLPVGTFLTGIYVAYETWRIARGAPAPSTAA